MNKLMIYINLLVMWKYNKSGPGIISEFANSTDPITAGQTFTSAWEECVQYQSVVLACKTDQAGTLYIDFSTDYGVTSDSTLSFSVAADTNEVHRITVTRSHFRVRFTNTSGSNQTYFRLQTLLGNHQTLTSPLNGTIQTDADSIITRSTLIGQTDGGSFKYVPVTTEGHIEVAVHSPVLPFGSIHTESLTPVIQTDAVYGINPQQVVTTTGLSFGTGANSGSVTGTNNLFTCSTGTTQYSFGTLQSRRRLRYRPGQGVVGRFAGFFTAPVASSILVAGWGSSESGYFFGYNGTSFGILHSTGGVREIQTLTITTASTSTNSYQVTQPNTTAITVTATNNSSTTRTAYEIAQGTYVGWKANAIGSTVVFVKDSVGNVSGTFSIAQSGAGSPAAGTCVETLAGVASTDVWYPQTEWNGDKLDGNGASGVTLDPTKGNVYQIGIQYLGFGSIIFGVEVSVTGNNPTFVTVHTLNFPNTRTSVTMVQPSFPFTMAAYSAGSTTNASVSVGSFNGSIEGKRVSIGPRQTYYNNSGVTSSTSAYVPLFTVKNRLVFNSRANQAVAHLLSLGGASKSNTGLTTFYMISNATLTGPTNFTSWSATSTTSVDTASTGCSFSENSQVIFTASISETGDFNYGFVDDQITLQPGESVTLAVRSVTSTSVCIGSLNTREDQ